MNDFVFMRVEMKYLCTKEQGENLQRGIERHMEKDRHGESTVQSLYFDTEDDRLVSASLDKPSYKEKLRARCYGINDSDRDVFLEMKRKANGIVYKRRVICKENGLSSFHKDNKGNSQMEKELSYFFSSYPPLFPKMMILYERTAFFDPESDLRVTFDRNIRYRTEDLKFSKPLCGTPILPEGSTLLEIKTGVCVPLWLCSLLASEKVFKTSFSKYGTAFLLEKSHRTGVKEYV